MAPSLLLTLAPLVAGGTPPELALVDVTLQDASADGAFDLALGHAVQITVTGEPGAAVLLAGSFTPPPDPPPVIGGAPLAVDPASLFLLAGPPAAIGPDGTFRVGTTVPSSLSPGSHLYLQALTLAGADLALTPGVVATAVEALVFDFAGGLEGFATDVTDYHVGMLPGIDPQTALATLPAPLDPSEPALRISFKNISDDVFFFLKRRIDGLAPAATRELRIDVRFASNVPVDSIGIGGSPGAHVFMKAGGATVEPVPLAPDPTGYVAINIDKDSHGLSGDDVHLIGNIGTPPGVWEWTLLENRMTEPLAVTADATGAFWICVGTDSGHEGETVLFYDRIVVKLLE